MKFYAPKYKQLDLGLLRSSLDELDKTNRWVALGDFLPWTELEKEYNSRLDNQKKGAGNKPARMILGAMIIKHKLNLSDAETIEIIRESPYMQYFCGLHEFTDKPIFDPSLFVTIRKRISEEELNKMTVKLLNKQRRLLEEKRKRDEEETKKNDEEPPTPEPEDPNAASFTDSKGREHKGVLKIDATCADAEMRYPVDVDIIHDGCRKVTDYIMKVCEMFELHKPRTNYKHARQAYLLLVKKAKKKGKMVRETIGVLAQGHPHPDGLACKEQSVLREPIPIRETHLDCHPQDVPSAGGDVQVKDSYLCRPHTEHLSATRPCHCPWKGQGKD